MAFGLAQGLEYLTALMKKILGELKDFCFFHIYNILVHGSNEKDHIEHLKIIFLKITSAGLKLKAFKMFISQKSFQIFKTPHFR